MHNYDTGQIFKSQITINEMRPEMKWIREIQRSRTKQDEKYKKLENEHEKLQKDFDNMAVTRKEIDRLKIWFIFFILLLTVLIFFFFGQISSGLVEGATRSNGRIT